MVLITVVLLGGKAFQRGKHTERWYTPTRQGHTEVCWQPARQVHTAVVDATGSIPARQVHTKVVNTNAARTHRGGRPLCVLATRRAHTEVDGGGCKCGYHQPMPLTPGLRFKRCPCHAGPKMITFGPYLDRFASTFRRPLVTRLLGIFDPTSG